MSESSMKSMFNHFSKNRLFGTVAAWNSLIIDPWGIKVHAPLTKFLAVLKKTEPNSIFC